jgi:SAM-dependent methyltransferase
MHVEAFHFVAKAVGKYGPFRRVLEIGSRDVNGAVRAIFWQSETYLGTDIAPGPGIDVVADGATVVPPFVPDCIVCCEVLEHASNAAEIVRHAAELLGPGGVLIVTCAAPERKAHSAIGARRLAPGEYYAGVPSGSIAGWLDCAADVSEIYDADRGDIQAVAVMV